MGLYKNYTIAKLRELADQLERKGIAEEALKAIADFDGSYKGVMELAGKMVVIADMSTFDDYWQEQTQGGMNKMVDRACSLIDKDTIK